MVSSGESPGVSQVPGSSFIFLILFIGAVLVTPMLIEPLIRKVLRNSPEVIEAERENAIAQKTAEIKLDFKSYEEE